MEFIPDASVSPSKLTSVEEFVRAIFDAVTSGNGALAASLVVLLILVAVRGLSGSRLPFLKTDAGGAGLILGLSILGALGNALAAGASFTGSLVLDTLTVALGAGGLELVRKLLAGLFGRPSAPPPPVVVAPVEMSAFEFKASEGEPPVNP